MERPEIKYIDGIAAIGSRKVKQLEQYTDHLESQLSEAKKDIEDLKFYIDQIPNTGKEATDKILKSESENKRLREGIEKLKLTAKRLRGNGHNCDLCIEIKNFNRMSDTDNKKFKRVKADKIPRPLPPILEGCNIEQYYRSWTMFANYQESRIKELEEKITRDWNEQTKLENEIQSLKKENEDLTTKNKHLQIQVDRLRKRGLDKIL